MTYSYNYLVCREILLKVEQNATFKKINRIYKQNFNNIFENKVIMSDKYHTGHISRETLVMPINTLSSHSERLV